MGRMADLTIPLESRDDFDGDDYPLAFTDFMIAHILENMAPTEEADRSITFDAEDVALACVLSLVLGCAAGVEFPSRIDAILDQTHPGEVETIVEDCRSRIEELTAAARSGTEALAPEDLIGEVLDSIREAGRIDAQSTQLAVSMSFEYGVVVARVHRGTALVLRNGFERRHRDLAEEVPPIVLDDEDDDIVVFPDGEDEDEGVDIGDDDLLPTLQTVVAGMMTEYEEAVGFGAE